VLSAAGKAGKVIDPMTYIAKGAGAGLSKIGDITKGLKGIGNMEIPTLPDGSFQLPDGHVLAPNGNLIPPTGALDTPSIPHATVPGTSLPTSWQIQPTSVPGVHAGSGIPDVPHTGGGFDNVPAGGGSHVPGAPASHVPNGSFGPAPAAFDPAGHVPGGPAGHIPGTPAGHVPSGSFGPAPATFDPAGHVPGGPAGHMPGGPAAHVPGEHFPTAAGHDVPTTAPHGPGHDVPTTHGHDAPHHGGHADDVAAHADDAAHAGDTGGHVDPHGAAGDALHGADDAATAGHHGVDGTDVAGAADDFKYTPHVSNAEFDKLSAAEKHQVALAEISDGTAHFPDDQAAVKYGREQWNDYADNLPQSQKDAVFDYTKEPPQPTPTYKEINGFLRGKPEFDTPLVRHEIGEIDKALAGNPMPEDMMVVRGTGLGDVTGQPSGPQLRW
ncbi:ADP-ribosyltransferase, partial [Streptomyces sp. NPDC005075]